MKKYLLLITLLLMCSCSRSTHQSSETTEKDDVENTEPSFSDIIEVVSVETGWYNGRFPQIKMKFKNISDKPIENYYIKIKYQFVEGNEVLYDGFTYIHTDSDVPWDNGIIKTEVLRTLSGYGLGGYRHVVSAKVCYKDNTVIWEGNIEQKIIY